MSDELKSLTKQVAELSTQVSVEQVKNESSRGKLDETCDKMNGFLDGEEGAIIQMDRLKQKAKLHGWFSKTAIGGFMLLGVKAIWEHMK